MNKRQCKTKNFLYTIISFVLITLFLSGCGKKNTSSDGTDMGKIVEDSVDIMGVRYNLYSNGYAEIEFMLNPYGELGETVTYNGKNYTVTQIENHATEAVNYGMFGLNGEYEAPETLIIPDTIQEIPNYAFHCCTSSSIVLPSNVKYISMGAFSQCSNIETIEFPDSLERLSASNLFAGCNSLKSVVLPEDVKYVLGTTDHLFAACYSLESATIPGTCGNGNLSENTFLHCESLTNITLGDGITTIHTRTFEDLPLIEELRFPNSVTEIQDQAIYDCPNLKDVWLSDNLSDVPAHMFKQAYGNYDADTSGITIHVKESLVDYVQNLYPDATVVAK